jgi:hypothetical protein
VVRTCAAGRRVTRADRRDARGSYDTG